MLPGQSWPAPCHRDHQWLDQVKIKHYQGDDRDIWVSVSSRPALARLTSPLTVCSVLLGEADWAAGYWWECSTRQIEVSRTIVFDAPRHARGFFEALIADNLDLGRPANVEMY